MADTQRSVKLRIVADAGTAKATLDDIASKADRIDGKHSSITVGVKSGTTKEQLDEITAKADALGIKNVRFSVKADTKEARAELDSLSLKLKKIAAEQDAAAAGSGLLRAGLFALGPAVVPIGAAGAALGLGLVPALAAGGIGLGVFAVAAKSAFAEITKADKANKKLAGGMGELQTQVNQAKSSWKDFVSQSADGIGHTLAPALSVIPKLLQDMKLFLAPAEAGLRTLAVQFKKAFNSASAQDFVHKLSGMVEPAIVNLGHAAGHVLHGLGGLFKDLMPHAAGVESLVNKIAADFDKWANSSKARNDIQKLFNFVNANGPTLKRIFDDLRVDIPKIASALSGFSSGSLSGLSVILTVIGKLSPGQLQLIAGGILGIKAATNAWKLATVALNAVMDFNPWMLALMAVAALVLVVVKYHKQLEAAVKKALHAISSAWDSALNAIKSAFKSVSSFISSTWNSIVSGARLAVSGLISFFTGLPGRIMNTLSSLGSMMWNIGSNIIWGIIRGVESAVGTLVGYIENVGHWISNAFSSVLHIFSPSRVFADHGKNIILGLVQGISGNANLATGAVSNLGRSVSSSLNVNATTAGRRGNTVYLQPQITVTGIVGDAGATGREIAKSLNEYLRQTGQGQLVGA